LVVDPDTTLEDWFTDSARYNPCMADESKYRNYLCDLGPVLLDRARQALQQRDGSRSSRQFYAGRLMAFNEVLSILIQQAERFEIPVEELRLEGIDLDRDFT
jgi:hypothetical protein